MLATVMHGPGDVRYEHVADPKILKPTDAIIKLSASCVCGSDLWPFRGLNDVTAPLAMGHEYCGVVVEVGSAVTSVKPGQFVVGSFCLSDNTCPHCKYGFQSSCEQREFMSGAQAPLARVPLADGTLVATAEMPSDDLIPSLLATSDVLGTGWYAADAARVQPGSTVVVVGDGAVGLMGVLSAKQMGAGRIIAMSRHKTRQDLALEYGATDIIAERGDAGVARIKEMTKGIGADSVLECVGTKESMTQAIQCARPGSMIGYVGVPHGVELTDGAVLIVRVRHGRKTGPVRRDPGRASGPPSDRVGRGPVQAFVDLAGGAQVLQLLQPGEGLGLEHRRGQPDALEDGAQLAGAALGGPGGAELGHALADLGEGHPVAAGVAARLADGQRAAGEGLRHDLGDLADAVVLRCRRRR